jgi:rRNA maturation endonuclease Nob1
MLHKLEHFNVDESYIYECEECEKFFAVEKNHDERVFCPYCGSDENISCDREESLIISNDSIFGR